MVWVIIGVSLLGALGLGLLGYYFWAKIPKLVFGIIDYVSYIVLTGVIFLFNIFARLARIIIDIFSVLNPFEEGGLASFLWEFFKNLSYVILVFLALYSGINWILNKEDQARRILFGVILIAFLINFSFLLAKVFFGTINFIQRSILLSANLMTENYNSSKLGTLIYTIFNAVPPGFIAEELKGMIENAIKYQTDLTPDQAEALRRALNIVANLVGIVLSLIFSLTLWSFVGIFIGRYFIIGFLAGLLPLAAIAYATPGYEKYWNTWWQWFLNWTVNVLILIVLILIGVALVATTTTEGITGAFNEEKLQSLMEPSLEVEPIAGLEESEKSTLSIFFAVSTKFVFLVIYFFIVLKASLSLGGVFANYTYGLALKGWRLAGAAAAGVGMWTVRPVISKIGGGISTIGKALEKSRVGFIRSLGLWTKGVGEKLEKPTKEKVKKEAEAIFSDHMEGKSPKEIAEIFERYRGPLKEELAKLMNSKLSADELFKVASILDWSKLDLSTRKALCGKKLRCVLTKITEGKEKRAEVLSTLPEIISHREVGLETIGTLLRKAGAEEEEVKTLLSNYFMFTSGRDLNDIFWNPENLKYLHDLGIYQDVERNIGPQRLQGIIRASPAARSIRELGELIGNSLSDALKNLPDNLKTEFQEALITHLTDLYLRGEITSTTVADWAKDPNKFLQDSIEGSLENLKSSIENQLKEIEEKIHG
ncbi:MAG: hypothetical protein QXW69_07875, partial [Nitrososphaerota archaeon]